MVAFGLREQQKRARRERIYQASVRLFHERGFQQTTVADIATAARVSRGTFFNYYAYKEAILLDYVAHCLRGLEQQIEEATRCGASPLDNLRTIFAELAKFVAGNPVTHLAAQL